MVLKVNHAKNTEIRKVLKKITNGVSIMPRIVEEEQQPVESSPVEHGLESIEVLLEHNKITDIKHLTEEVRYSLLYL